MEDLFIVDIPVTHQRLGQGDLIGLSFYNVDMIWVILVDQFVFLDDIVERFGVGKRNFVVVPLNQTLRRIALVVLLPIQIRSKIWKHSRVVWRCPGQLGWKQYCQHQQK